ncbi:MAG: GNAT family N-acetyltransferase [Phycisphaerales bacterium]|nr:GNAT family N-acetyltransferase [Phycisphaerales bacterium]
MHTTQPVPSLASLRESAETVAATNLDAMFRAIAHGPNVHTEPAFMRLVTGLPHPLGNLAIMANAFDAQATARAIEPLLQNTFPSATIFASTPSAEVAACMQAAGFALQPAMPGMVVEMNALTPTTLAPGLEFKRISVSDGDIWADVLARGYGLPLGVAAEFRPTVVNTNSAPDAALQFFAILRNGVMLATSLLFLHEGVAGIYCVATLVEERKKGLGAHLTAEPLRIARALGYRVGVLQATPDGEPVYKKLGFQTVSEIPMFVRMPSSVPGL